MSKVEQKYPSDIRQTIVHYLHQLPPEILGIARCEPVEVLEKTHGTYNVNYHVRVSGKDFIFRINIEQQSGLSNQIEYEFESMKLLDGYGIAPKAYHLDDTRTSFDFGILIEEYLDGSHVQLEETEMPEIANLLVRLHGLPVQDTALMVWNDPLVDNYLMVENDLREYEAKVTPDLEVARLSKELMRRLHPCVERFCHLFVPDGMNHTDTAIDNFLKTANGLRLIDWEKPRLDDCTYDVCCFLCEPAQLWCAPRPLSQKGREIFLDAYIRLSGREEALFQEKVKIREPLVALHWVLWGANKLCDLRDARTAAELIDVHQSKVERWERMAQPKNIAWLLENICPG